MARIRKLRTLADLPLEGKRVIVRVDFNVPIGDDGKVDEFEDYRITSALSTIRELQKRHCVIILMTHLGRPKASGSATWDLDPIQRRLEELLNQPVKAVPALYGNAVETVLRAQAPGSVALLSNIRFDKREVAGTASLAENISTLADAYVNEAFSVSHRAHASVAILPTLLPSCAGLRTQLEVEVLSRLRARPHHPYVAIVSGAKIATKVGLLKRLSSRVDYICLGGQIANVFLCALGKYNALHYNARELAIARGIMAQTKSNIILPLDLVVGPHDGVSGNVEVYSADELPYAVAGVWDIGPRSVQQIIDICKRAKTVLWNGPVGRFEIEAYAKGTLDLARSLADLSAFRVVGGGDTVNALERLRVTARYNHVSVGGGAMVAYIEGKAMPGLTPLYGKN